MDAKSASAPAMNVGDGGAAAMLGSVSLSFSSSLLLSSISPHSPVDVVLSRRSISSAAVVDMLAVAVVLGNGLL